MEIKNIYAKDLKNITKKYFKSKEYLSDSDVTELYNIYRDDLQANSKRILARNKLIYSQLNLVQYFASKEWTSIVKGKRQTTLTEEDLIAYGNQKLVEHIDKFDPKSGTTLSTYIRTYVVGYIKTYAKKNSRTIKIPTSRVDTIILQNKLTEEFYTKYGRYPEDGEKFGYKKFISKDGGYIKKDMVHEFKNIDRCESISGNIKMTDSENTFELFDVISERNSELSFELEDSNENISNAVKQALNKVYATMTEQEKQIVELSIIGSTPVKDMPFLLVADSQSEQKQLEKTSKNILRIDVTFEDGVQDSLEYVIKCAKQFKGTKYSDELVFSKERRIVPETHHFCSMETNNSLDYYKFHLKNASKINVKLINKTETYNVDFKYNGNTLYFDIEYLNGSICTAMSCVNKKKAALKKLRINFLPYKSKIYGNE